MDTNLPGSSVHGILQARILEWVAISSSRGSSWPRDRTWVSDVSCTGRFFTNSATWMPMYSCPLFFGFPSHLGPTEHGAERALTGSLFSLAFGFTSGCCASGCCDRLWAGISLGTSAGMVQMPLGFQFLSLPIRKAGSCPSSPVARLVLLGPPAASLGEPAGWHVSVGHSHQRPPSN